jgi:glycosyltransferase 2 family protein
VIARLAASLWVRLALTAVILVLLGRGLDFGEALRAILRVDPRALLVVALLVAVDRVVMIWRWVLLLRATGSPVTTRAASRIFLVSSFVGSFLPAGVGGDAARAWQLSQHTARGHEAVA